MNTKRLDWIDIAKGIGIILVVLGHTLVPQVRETGFAGFLWIFIYNFHMPLFFFLSGYLFEKGLFHYTNKGKFILGKLQYLMLPYLIFSTFAYLFIGFSLKIPLLAKVLENGGYTAVDLKDAILQIVTYNNHIDKHLWFVFSLFIVFLVNILIPKIMKSKPMLIVLLGLYISKAYVHYYGILDYVTSDLLFFSLARIAFSTKNKKSINTYCHRSDIRCYQLSIQLFLRYTNAVGCFKRCIVFDKKYLVRNGNYDSMQHFKTSSKQSTAKIIKNTRYVFV